MTPNPYLTELAQSMAPSLEPVTRPFHADCLEPMGERKEAIADECMVPQVLTPEQVRELWEV